MLRKCIIKSIRCSVFLVIFLFSLREICIGQTASVVTGGPLATLSGGNPNMLINGGFNVNQRDALTSYNNKYPIDRWKIYASGENVVSATLGDIISTDPSAVVQISKSFFKISLLQSGSSMAIQIIENKNILPLLGSKASLSFYAKSPTAGGLTLKAAVLCWTGASDSPSSPVSGWGDVPTWGTSWQSFPTSNNIPGFTINNTWAQYSIADISVSDKTCKNLAVAIWPTTTLATNAEWDLAGVKLEAGPHVTAWAPRFISDELQLAQHYYSCSTPPGIFAMPIAVALSGWSTQWFPAYAFPGGPMRIAPIVTVYSTSSNSVNKIYQIDGGGADISISGVPYLSASGVSEIDTATSLNAGMRYSARICADAEFY